MALHRDIFWIGRQWAVTGFGVQAVDQRLKGAFDVEAAKLWEDDLPQRMRSLAWINVEDFSKALDVARARFPELPGKKGLPLVESVLELLQPAAQESPKPAPPPTATAAIETGQMRASPPEAVAPRAELLRTGPPPVEPSVMELPIGLPQPISRPLALRVEHATAKFLPRWRIRR